ncbi:MAG: radical SAM protein, partial [Pseudomonadota bacterium]|nr:radical SAM protein [Pseudomonadota bacterium]
LPWEVAPLFMQWLEAHFPDRAARVMNRVREMRGGKNYDSQFGKRMTGDGAWAALIRQRFAKGAAKFGLDRELAPLRNDLFVAPRIATPQLVLF